MLWSDPENEPPEDLRATQHMLRRLTFLLPVAMILVVIVTGLR
ncbi:morphogenic membrane protein MmpB [Streptomyces sp. NPDC048182]